LALYPFFMNPMIDSLLTLAIEHHLAGRIPAASTLYEQVLSLQPACPDALCNLGQIRGQLGQTDEALHLLQKAVALAPDHAPALLNLGATLLRQGDAAAALPLLDRAIQQDPGSFMAWNNRGLALQKLDRRAEAAQSFTQALQIRPTHDAAHNNLGLLLHELGRGSEAITHFRRALDLHPDAAETSCNLAAPLLAQGRVDDAIRCYERALSLRPDLYEAHTGLLMALHYGDASPEKEAALQAARARFAATFPARAPRPPLVSLRRPLPHPGRPLRIGYVSPDLRAHSVSFFIAPLLRAHDRDRAHVTCYASVARPDAVTARLRGLADAWRDVHGLSDEALAAAVRADEIDVLVDLAGHTSGNRLRAFLHRPAPLQVTYLGYPDRTGLPTMDARLTDALADPPEDPADGAEPLLRLPRCFLCYEPPADAPPPSPLPADRSRVITFASFNNLPKLSPATLAAWAEILKALPTSRLLLKSAAFSDPGAVAFTQERFRRHGVDPARLGLRPLTPSIAAHLACYHEADIALDTFPYHGTTTTCEALFMGLPVVTLAGPSHKSRVGVSLLHQVGLPSLIAQGQGWTSYVRLAIALAEDLPRLRALRATLRRHLLASPLCDARSLARSIEDAFLSMARGDVTGCATSAG
jgi:predicted O-linked N-acetylglucosamine transferase (SPINDLY family)